MKNQLFIYNFMETRMGIIRVIASVILLFGFLSPGLLASGFENTGIGTKARGMAGAFRAIADDWTAAYYNPAGYAFIYDNQLGMAGGFTHFRDELTPDYRYSDNLGNTYETGVYNDLTLYNQHQINFMPSAGFVVRVPVWGETVFGLSGYQPFDNKLEWTVFEPLLAYNDSIYHEIPTNQIKNDLDVVAFQVTAAREFVQDELSLGLGLQVLRADMDLKNVTFRNNPLASPLSDRPYDNVPELSSNVGDGWGFGFTAGMLWKVNEKLNVALTGSVPFDITLKGTSDLRYVMPKNDFAISEGNPDRYLAGTVEYLFSDGQMVTVNADFETKLKLPASFGVGFAYQATEKLMVALDATYTLWSSFDGFAFTYSNLSGVPIPALADQTVTDFFTADLNYPTDWKNTGKFALGVDYQASRYIGFVGGVSFEQSPQRDTREITPLFVSPGDRYGFNGGILASINQWDLGLITSYYYYPDDLTVSGVVDLNNDGIDDNFPGTYSAGTYETVLSVNYRF
ncbi:MAG: outer membrane protein transport protein [Candidatus Zixiibacteriota bacterium]